MNDHNAANGRMEEKSMYDHLIGKPVLVRSHLGGMYLGTLLAAHEDGTLHLLARRLWSWRGALDSTVLASTGPTEGRIGPAADILLRPAAQVIEILAASTDAIEELGRIGTWRR